LVRKKKMSRKSVVDDGCGHCQKRKKKLDKEGPTKTALGMKLGNWGKGLLRKKKFKLWKNKGTRDGGLGTATRSSWALFLHKGCT